MVKSFLVSMFAILVFTLGAAGAWFYMQMQLEAGSDDEGVPVAVAPAEASPIPQFNDADAPLPAVVRGPQLDPDELYRIETATAAQRNKLREYEDRIREQKSRIKAADIDTKAAQREVEGAASHVNKMLHAAETTLQEVRTELENLKKEAAEIQKRKDELQKVEDEVGVDAAANIKNFAEFMQSMPAEKSAAMIQNMSDSGKMDFAVQLLRNIEGRNASKILAQIEDESLVSEIAERYRDLPRR